MPESLKFLVVVPGVNSLDGDADDDCEAPSLVGVFRRLQPAELSRWGAIGKVWG